MLRRETLGKGFRSEPRLFLAANNPVSPPCREPSLIMWANDERLRWSNHEGSGKADQNSIDMEALLGVGKEWRKRQWSETLPRD